MATQTDQAPAERPTRPGRPAKGGKRTTPIVFVRQVVAELRKVIWPTRHELATYTTAALIFIVVLVALVTGLDALLGKIVLEVFG
jgi:preprotein translocase subunit SecE